MRPASIVAFERLSLLALAIAVVASVMNWDREIAAYTAQGVDASLLPIVMGGLAVLYAALILLISRGRSTVAKWIYVALTVVGLVLVVPQLGAMFSRGVLGLVQALQLLLQVAALVLLFKRESNEWLARKAAP